MTTLKNDKCSLKVSLSLQEERPQQYSCKYHHAELQPRVLGCEPKAKNGSVGFFDFSPKSLSVSVAGFLKQNETEKTEKPERQ